MGKNKKHKNDKSIVNRPQAATTDIAGKADTTTSFSDNIISSDPDKVKAHELAKNDNPASETITTSITDEVRAAAVSPDIAMKMYLSLIFLIQKPAALLTQLRTKHLLSSVMQQILLTSRRIQTTMQMKRQGRIRTLSSMKKRLMQVRRQKRMQTLS